MNDVEMMFRLPFKIAAEREIPYHIILEEFQNIMNDKDYDDILKVMEISRRMQDTLGHKLESYVLRAGRSVDLIAAHE